MLVLVPTNTHEQTVAFTCQPEPTYAPAGMPAQACSTTGPQAVPTAAATAAKVVALVWGPVHSAAAVAVAVVKAALGVEGRQGA